MTKFGVNTDNALNAISKISFTVEERFNEYIGGLATEAKSIIKVDTKNDHIIIIAGDDEGFTELNQNSFYNTYDSNGYGLGEHGQGMRAAFNYYIDFFMNQ